MAKAYGDNGEYAGQDTNAYKEALAQPGVFTLARLKQLSANPTWNQGHADWQGATNVYNVFKSTYGRDPTQAEINMYAPLGAAAGPAIAQQKYAEDNSPDAINLKNQTKLAADAPKNYDTVNQSFQSLLGRDATDSEKSHFGSLIASGQYDPYQVQQALMQTQEYQNTANQKQQAQLQTTLQGTNADYFSQHILPTLQSQFASQGRQVDSSGFQNATAQAAKQQNYDLENYLARAGTGQYNQSMANQTGMYQDYLNQNYGRQNTNLAAQYGATQSNVGRQQNLQDFQIQQNAYNNYLQNYGKRSGGIGGALSGALSGAVAGAQTTKSPWGALAGAGIGGGLGYGAGQI